MDNKFCGENSNRAMFGLFDFDDAYNQWNIKKDVSVIETNVAKGLAKKRDGKDVYFMLLPVPEQHPLQDQVVNQKSKAHFRSESRFSIEHHFFGPENLKTYFPIDETRPRYSCVKFSESSKFDFATKVVPTLPKSAFEGLRPLFEFVCTASAAKAAAP